MNKIPLGFMIVVLVSTNFLKNVNAVKCYSCAGCDTVSGTTATSTCSGQCQKTVASTNTAGIAITTISRECVATCTATSASGSAGIGSIGVSNAASVSCCSTDLCNSSTNIKVSKLMSFVLLSITAIIGKLIL